MGFNSGFKALKTSKYINVTARFNCRCPHFRNIK